MPARMPWTSEKRPAAARSGRDEADAEQRFKKAALHAGDAGLHRAQVKSAPAGDQHQAHHLDLEEFAQVVDERGGCARLGRVDHNRSMGGACNGGCGAIFRKRGLRGGSHVDG